MEKRAAPNMATELSQSWEAAEVWLRRQGRRDRLRLLRSDTMNRFQTYISEAKRPSAKAAAVLVVFVTLMIACLILPSLAPAFGPSNSSSGSSFSGQSNLLLMDDGHAGKHHRVTGQLMQV